MPAKLDMPRAERMRKTGTRGSRVGALTLVTARFSMFSHSYQNCRLSRSARPWTFDQTEPLATAVTYHRAMTLRQLHRANALFLSRLATIQGMISEGYNPSSVLYHEEIGCKEEYNRRLETWYKDSSVRS